MVKEFASAFLQYLAASDQKSFAYPTRGNSIPTAPFIEYFQPSSGSHIRCRSKLWFFLFGHAVVHIRCEIFHLDHYILWSPHISWAHGVVSSRSKHHLVCSSRSATSTYGTLTYREPTVWSAVDPEKLSRCFFLGVDTTLSCLFKVLPRDFLYFWSTYCNAFILRWKSIFFSHTNCLSVVLRDSKPVMFCLMVTTPPIEFLDS